MYIINMIRGFFMALADSVPGVSGGTVAFILGFYDEFINSLNALTSHQNNRDRYKAITFLMKLGIGWVIGMVLSMLFISSIFDAKIYEISSLFTGFIICSIPIIIREEKSSIVGAYKNIIFAIIGIVVVVAISYFNPASHGSGTNMFFESMSLKFGIYVFVSGMIAISAMVLPGISGSTLLLIFGLYSSIVSSIKEVLTLNFEHLPMLIVFGLGVITGILSVIKLIKYLLAHYRSQMIYLIIGLMIGSIYAVFMGPVTLQVPQEPMSLQTFNFIYFAIGGLLIFGLEQMKDVSFTKSTTIKKKNN
ncbi:MAG: DUF368 domain-containing protein [Cellulosilyticaceae bacterium]